MTDVAPIRTPPRDPKIAKTTAGVTAGALALMMAAVATHEGEINKTYVDRLGKGQPLTVCYGETKGVQAGKVYSHNECLGMLKVSALAHASDAHKCLPPELPDATAAAFYDLAYNIGTGGFCKSSVARKAKAGDLRGACQAIGLYVYSAGKDCRIKANRCGGIARRRADEMTLCLGGLK